MLSILLLVFMGQDEHAIFTTTGSISVRILLFPIAGFPALCLGLFLLGEIRARSITSLARERLQDDRVEQCVFTIHRALKIDTDQGLYLLLKIVWNGKHLVMFIPPSS